MKFGKKYAMNLIGNLYQLFNKFKLNYLLNNVLKKVDGLFSNIPTKPGLVLTSNIFPSLK